MNTIWLTLTGLAALSCSQIVSAQVLVSSEKLALLSAQDNRQTIQLWLTQQPIDLEKRLASYPEVQQIWLRKQLLEQLGQQTALTQQQRQWIISQSNSNYQLYSKPLSAGHMNSVVVVNIPAQAKGLLAHWQSKALAKRWLKRIIDNDFSWPLVVTELNQSPRPSVALEHFLTMLTVNQTTSLIDNFIEQDSLPQSSNLLLTKLANAASDNFQRQRLYQQLWRNPADEFSLMALQHIVKQTDPQLNQTISIQLLKRAKDNKQLTSLALNLLAQHYGHLPEVSEYLNKLKDQPSTEAGTAAALANKTLATSASNLAASVAEIYTYTEADFSFGKIPLGYPVPEPVDSLTPVDGFRRYSSLHARHQQMTSDADFISAQVIGQTIHGEHIWLYTVSDSDDQTTSGSVEGVTLINGGIHAREWQTPEAVTGMIEHLYDHQQDKYIATYLIENLKMQFVPVLNIDGFKQTQNYPNLVTLDPDTPRDGRMRRKNRRDVDTELNSDSDNLLGIDLNRNNDPYWATTSASSTDPESLVYHGAAPASEPEIQALINAADQSPANRLRLFLDVHSFSQVYFTPLTGDNRRNTVTAQVMSNMRAANNFKYSYDPSAPNAGIGTTADYFAANYEIPAATLEIEPSPNGAADYGGNGVSHDGFILPNGEVRRMVKEVNLATLAGFYTQADKPILQQLIIREISSNQILVNASWLPSSDGRTLVFEQFTPLVQNVDYQISLSFNKPMRWMGDSGQISHFPSMITPLQPSVQWLGQDKSGNSIAIELDTSNGSWQLNPSDANTAGYRKYKTDTFTFTANWGIAIDEQQLQRIALAVETTDMLKQRLDANPATTVDWSQGHWQNYESSNGETADTGGFDMSFRIIDDGTELFPQAPSPNPTTPTTPTQPSSSASGGGSLGWGVSGLLLLVGFIRRRLR